MLLCNSSGHSQICQSSGTPKLYWPSDSSKERTKLQIQKSHSMTWENREKGDLNDALREFHDSKGRSKPTMAFSIPSCHCHLPAKHYSKLIVEQFKVWHPPSWVREHTMLPGCILSAPKFWSAYSMLQLHMGYRALHSKSWINWA